MSSQNTIECLKGKPCQVGTFGCNGKSPQASFEVEDALAGTIGSAVSTVSGTYTQAEVNAIVALVNQLRTEALASRTLLNELRDGLVANGTAVAAS